MAIQRIEFGRRDEVAAGGCCSGGACMCGGHGEAGASASHGAATPGSVEIGVDGMTCQHCVNAVTEELTSLPEVSGVQVELVSGGVSRVRVSAAGPLDREAVRAAVEDAGYRLATLPD